MKKWLLAVLLVLVILGIAVIWRTHHPALNSKKEALLVAVSPVTVASLPLSVQTTGTLVANQQTTISPKVGGYIKGIHFQEGEWVSAGAVLLTLEANKEQQAYRSAVAEATLDRATYHRYLKLRQSGAIAQQEIDQYQAKFKQSTAAQKSAEAALKDMELVAPFAGYVGARSVSVGNYVNVGQNLLSLTDTNELRIEYSLPSRYVSLLKLQQPVTMQADYLPGQVFHAVVSYVSPFVDANTQTIEVHARFDNHEQKLKPGQSINIAQTLGQESHALLIPADAFTSSMNGDYVYEVENNKVITVPIVVGDHYQDKIVVLKGVSEKELIITEGQFQVKAGQIVRVVNR